MLTNLADSFQQFYDSGTEHYNAANNMLSSMQDIGKLCSSSHGSTVSTPIQKVNKVLCVHGDLRLFLLCNLIWKINLFLMATLNLASN